MKVKAMADGKVTNMPSFKAGQRASRNMDMDTYSTIEIQHGEYRVIYGGITHGDISDEKRYVEEGDEVTQGQIIASTSETDDFYIEMYKGQERVNPDRYIEEDLLPRFSNNMERRYWEENVISYSMQDFNSKYFKEFKIGNINIIVHEIIFNILEEIKDNNFTSWHPDEVVILGNPNIYDTDRFNIKNITTNQEKIIQSGIGVLVLFDKDNNKGTNVNKYINELVDLLNINNVMSIIIYSEGVYFDIGPKQLINNNDNIEDPFDKLPNETKDERRKSKEVEDSRYSNNEDREDIEWLARVINGEARGEPFKGQVAVGAVVINRTEHSNYPDDIKGVVNQEGQFDAVSDGQIDLYPGEEQFKAARQAIAGVDPTDGAIYYYNPDTSTDESFIDYMESLEHKVEIGDHIFARP